MDHIAYIARTLLEHRAAVAEWKDGRLTVWTGTQRPFGVRGDLARAFNLKAELVRVIVPDAGSGYGGKAEVAVDRSTGKVQVVRLVTAFECGAIVNPDHLKNQVEGAVVMGERQGLVSP